MHLIILAMKVFVIRHAGQYAVLVYGLVEWCCNTMRIVTARSEIPCGKFYHVGSTKLARH